MDGYIDDGNTLALWKEWRYRTKSGFHKRYGGKWRGLLFVLRSIFVK